MNWTVQRRSYSTFLPTLIVVVLHLQIVASQVDKVCRSPLGMEDKRIPDFNLSATSKHADGTGPRFARLNRDEGDGAWCPYGLITSGTEDEYIQINLHLSKFITRVTTQGRFGHGQGQEFVRSYKVNYSRDGLTWFTWSDARGVNILQGNVDVNNVKVQLLNPSIAGAKHIRIIPVTRRDMPVCLRLELYGCPWNTGLVSYEIPTPVDYSANRPARPTTMYSDDIYDGRRTSSDFTGGLGQLTDGIVGNGDVSRTNSRYQTTAKGYDYVGWSKNDNEERNVVMVFRFDNAKNFTSLRVHCNHNEALGAKLFSAMRVSYSLDGRKYFETADSAHLSFNTDIGDSAVTSRFVTIPLRHLIARVIKVSFTLGGKYLLISEVEFYNSELPAEVADRYSADYESLQDLEEITSTTQTLKPTVNEAEGVNIAVIVGVLVGVIVLLALVVIVLYYRHRKLRKTLTPPPSYSYHASTSRGDHMVTLTPLIPSGGPNGGTGPMETKPPMPIYQEIGPTVIPPDNLYLEPTDVVRPPPPPYQRVQAGDQSACGVSIQLPDGSRHGEPSNISHYAETDVFLPKLEVQAIQGVSGNNVYAVPWSTPSPRRHRRKNKGKKSQTLPALHGTTASASSTIPADELNDTSFHLGCMDEAPEFPRNKLEFIEKLGEGMFGEVQLCRADPSIRDFDDNDEFALAGEPGSPVLVAVKILREGASSNAKEDFLKEVRVMARLQDPNIVRLLAVCTKDEPFAMITEYMEHGDLNQYMRSFDDDITPAPGKNAISNGTIMKMAAQIASGMAYLSSLNFVHRDLATRNCLVGANDSIRIGDFGMSRNMYQSDYYRIQGRAVLPIRWMSWECVLMGKFSSASDVWSFGVTLWEMFSLCKYQPHGGLSDQQVIENMHYIFRRTGEEVYLPRPKRCPASLFNMIRQCWKRACEDRPTFDQLHTYLLERQTSKASPKPKRPQVKPPTPKPRIRLSQ